MESLFSTTLNFNNQKVLYQVYFNEEKYIFLPEEKDKSSSFSFKREHDEWHNQDDISAEVKLQATNALDTYLLAQH